MTDKPGTRTYIPPSTEAALRMELEKTRELAQAAVDTVFDDILDEGHDNAINELAKHLKKHNK